jgi:DNA invertase Pin-like site-specific DNA recombinase
MTTRAAIYCRVSTDRQEREGASLETQLLGCKEVCEGKGLPVVLEYTDVESGLNFDRPDYQKMARR